MGAKTLDTEKIVTASLFVAALPFTYVKTWMVIHLGPLVLLVGFWLYRQYVVPTAHQGRWEKVATVVFWLVGAAVVIIGPWVKLGGIPFRAGPPILLSGFLFYRQCIVSWPSAETDTGPPSHPEASDGSSTRMPVENTNATED